MRRAGGDCFGHGTAVASLAAGYASGLAPRADVVSARVLDCDGDGRVSDVVAGVDWALEHFRNAKASGNPAPSAVMTLSLGVQPAGSGARSLEAAVRAATRAGVAAFVASGNAPGSPRPADAAASPGRTGARPAPRSSRRATGPIARGRTGGRARAWTRSRRAWTSERRASPERTRTRRGRGPAWPRPSPPAPRSAGAEAGASVSPSPRKKKGR